MKQLKETLIKGTSRSEITIEEELEDMFVIRRWNNKTGSCTDSIFFNKSDLKTIFKLIINN